LVTRDSDRVVVAVTDGTVEVTTLKPGHARRSLNHAFAPIPALTPIRIYRGEEVVLRDNGALSPVRLTDTHAATAWIHGRLIFENQPLRYVIETVDRYSSLRITVSPSAGGLRFSGIVFEDEVDEWLQGLEKIFPVTIEDRGVSVCVHLRDSEPVRMRDESCPTQ
jgi:transmembrane sensor